MFPIFLTVEFLVSRMGMSTFSVKRQRVKVLDFVGYIVFITTTQPWYGSMKAATDKK